MGQARRGRLGAAGLGGAGQGDIKSGCGAAVTRRRSTLPVSVLEAVDARSDGQCEIRMLGCAQSATEYHHRLPRRMGGSRWPAVNSAANILHVCAACHRLVEHERTWAKVYGYLIPSWPQDVNPADAPVFYRFREWCLLDDAGRRTPVVVELS